MTTDEAQELADSIEAEKLWRVHEIVIQPGCPRDTWLRVKRGVYSSEIEIGSVQIEAAIRTAADYEIVCMLATATTSVQGGELHGIPW